ncbi:MAG: hypothetical protein EA393_06370 [Bacteroidetes bacterium]|nr:MAG: hypothetical protein EA393_06370 [Bacteroidota bacterium]
MQDTPEHIIQKQREIIHSKSPDERFMIGVEAINFGRKMVESSIRQSNPHISEIDLKVETFKRYYSQSFDPEELKKILEELRAYWVKRLKTG